MWRAFEILIELKAAYISDQLADALPLGNPLFFPGTIRPRPNTASRTVGTSLTGDILIKDLATLILE